jgi:hypothetical protein
MSILGLEVRTDVGVQARGVAHDRLPVLVSKPGIRIFSANPVDGVDLGATRGTRRHRAVVHRRTVARFSSEVYGGLVAEAECVVAGGPVFARLPNVSGPSRKRRDFVEHVEETLPGAETPSLRLDWPRPKDVEPEPPKPRAVNEEDARRVRERVHADLLVFPPDLQVRVRAGVLVLEGRASTPQEHKRIEVLAREVIGNAVIENRMLVGGSARLT